MNKYILAIDQGTTSTRAVLVNAKTFTLDFFDQKEHTQVLPAPGYVEHDLNEIWQNTELTIRNVLKKSGIAASSIIGIGITNQRETVCAFDKKGTPLHHALVWQDQRTHSFCESHKKQFSDNKLNLVSGLPLNPYFSASKITWLLQNSAIINHAQKSNNLCIGTMDTFLLYKLTAGSSFFTDTTNASRLQLLDLTSIKWSEDLLSFFNISKDILPSIKNTFDTFGVTQGLDFLPDGIPINCLIGDQQSALLGQGGFRKHDLKCTYGTGAFLLLNTGETPIYSNFQLLTTIAFTCNNITTYALEGSSFIAGAAVQWLRDQLGMIKNSSEIEGLAQKISNLSQVENLHFFPYFSGAGAPYWNSKVKAALVGMSRDTAKEHIAYVCLEGIAQSIADLVETMEKDLTHKILHISVDGGASKNDLLLTMQAKLLNCQIFRPGQVETTVLGAAFGVALAQKLISLDDLKQIIGSSMTKFSPTPTSDKAAQYYLLKRSSWHAWNKKLIS